MRLADLKLTSHKKMYVILKLVHGKGN